MVDRREKNDARFVLVGGCAEADEHRRLQWEARYVDFDALVIFRKKCACIFLYTYIQMNPCGVEKNL